VLLVAVVSVGVVMLLSSSPTLGADSAALAKVGMPFGGGTIESVTATGPRGRSIPVEVRGDRIWPQRPLRAGEQVTISVVVKRPGSIGWLTGSTQHVSLTLTTPTARLIDHYVTVAAGAPLRVRFAQPVAVVTYGTGGHLGRHVLASSQTVVTLPRSASAGTYLISATPRTWETARTSVLSWFPAGARAGAVALPAPGSTIGPSTPITLTFSKSVAQALGSSRPPVSPATAGTWHTVNSHTIVFDPSGYGYGLGATVRIGLPSGIQLVGGTQSGSDPIATYTVPGGSTIRLQQLLASLGYLPLNFNTSGASVATTPAAQEAAAITPPAGSFTWRWGNTPGELRAIWQPGASGVMTRGAVMKFEDEHGMTADGVAGAAVWKALINDALAGHSSAFGYTFVHVTEGSPESESTWHDGRTVVSGPVNTGIAAAPTATGIYPVFEHALSVTMSGTNPDGSHYSDPGVPYVSYFNGGDALHGFIRPGYGWPQSLGCVEMPYSEASSVYPYTPIGTLVDVT
jgi:peptidoglycan hydrolase-like protein with peptidoglycan-binding domain